MAAAILIAALTGATLLLFYEPEWWFPQAISIHAQDYDVQFLRTLWVAGLIFLLSQALLCWVIFRFRDRGLPASRAEGSRKLEILWSAATGVVFIGLAAAGQGIWARVHLENSSPDSIRVEVLARQFAWSFRYPGADGSFGRIDIRQVDDSAGNPFGIDSRDSRGRDDITTALLHVPAGQPVELLLRSRDVIHSFFVRELRLKQDVVPGMTIPLRFTAEKPGTYEVPCSELCGLGHHQMRSALVVMTTEAFEAWLREEAGKAAGQ